jgi:hypothetical protein
MSRDDGMDEHGIDWFYGYDRVGFWLGKLSNHSCFHHALTTNLTQHDVHGPDDSTKTIDYHHLVIGWDEVLHQEIAKIISCLESYPKLTAVYHRDRTAAIAVSP